jgi:hypothetical protein
MSKGLGSSAFPTSPSPSSNEDNIGINFGVSFIVESCYRLFYFLMSFEGFDISSLETYWHKIVSIMKGIVFVCIIILFWIYIIRPRWKKRRLDPNRWN